jgi:ABC-2 type transport system ATP-binding protein
MSTPILSVKNVRVEYETVVAVDHVSLEIEAGMILGLLGPNGAGKSSLMKAIAGLVEITSGEISICGASLLHDRALALATLGFQPDIPPTYGDLSVK